MGPMACLRCCALNENNAILLSTSAAAWANWMQYIACVLPRQGSSWRLAHGVWLIDAMSSFGAK